MDILIFLVPLALLLGLTGLLTFVWALRSGQFDDPEGAALRVLSDDDLAREQQSRRERPMAAAGSGRTSAR